MKDLQTRLDHYWWKFNDAERQEFLSKALQQYSFWRRVGDHTKTDTLRKIIGFFQARMDAI